MNGSTLIPVMPGRFIKASSLMDSFFNDDFFSSFFNGDMPEGTKTYKKDILDKDGNKIGEHIVSTYSSGRAHAPRDLVGSNFPPCNIYTDESKRKVYEFAVAGYSPDNITFEANPEEPDVIDLVLKSDFEEVISDSDSSEEEHSNTTREQRAYDYEGFKVKDYRTPFRVDTRKYDLEDAEVEIKNGVAKISFGPKTSTFKPKLIKSK